MSRINEIIEEIEGLEKELETELEKEIETKKKYHKITYKEFFYILKRFLF